MFFGYNSVVTYLKMNILCKSQTVHNGQCSYSEPYCHIPPVFHCTHGTNQHPLLPLLTSAIKYKLKQVKNTLWLHTVTVHVGRVIISNIRLML